MMMSMMMIMIMIMMMQGAHFKIIMSRSEKKRVTITGKENENPGDNQIREGNIQIFINIFVVIKKLWVKYDLVQKRVTTTAGT